MYIIPKYSTRAPSRTDPKPSLSCNYSSFPNPPTPTPISCPSPLYYVIIIPSCAFRHNTFTYRSPILFLTSYNYSPLLYYLSTYLPVYSTTTPSRTDHPFSLPTSYTYSPLSYHISIIPSCISPRLILFVYLTFLYIPPQHLHVQISIESGLHVEESDSVQDFVQDFRGRGTFTVHVYDLFASLTTDVRVTSKRQSDIKIKLQ